MSAPVSLLYIFFNLGSCIYLFQVSGSLQEAIMLLPSNPSNGNTSGSMESCLKSGVGASASMGGYASGLKSGQEGEKSKKKEGREQYDPMEGKLTSCPLEAKSLVRNFCLFSTFYSF